MFGVLTLVLSWTSLGADLAAAVVSGFTSLVRHTELQSEACSVVQSVSAMVT